MWNGGRGVGPGGAPANVSVRPAPPAIQCGCVRLSLTPKGHPERPASKRALVREWRGAHGALPLGNVLGIV